MFQSLYNLIKLSASNLLANRVRSGLTMLGIVWGIASVIILIGIVSGFYQENLRRWQDFGLNMLVLDYSSSYEVEGTRYPLTPDEKDADFLERENPYVLASAAEIRFYREIQVEEKKQWFPIVATTEKMATLKNLKPSYGRFLTHIDDSYERKVAVIGNRIKETFFEELEDEKVLGKDIFIGGRVFTVVGVFEQRRTTVDWTCFIPLSTYKSVFGTSGRSHSELTIYASLRSITDYEKGKTYAIRQLASKYGFNPTDKNAIRVRDFAEWRKSAMTTFLMFFGLFYSVGVMTLAVGAIGVANVMLVAVQERTREIGLRKAVGATPVVIMAQVTIETLVICLIGGVIGIALGLVIVGVMRTLPLPETFPPPIVTLPSIYIALIVDILAGLLSAFYPARRAALLDPIVALREQ